MNSKGKEFPELSSPDWLADLAFLTDLTGHLNSLNNRLQGRDQLVTHLYDHIKSFVVKLTLWESQLKTSDFYHFVKCNALFAEGQKLQGSRYAEIIEKLRSEFEERFRDFSSHTSEFELFGNPFPVEPGSAATNFQLELIDLQCTQVQVFKLNFGRILQDLASIQVCEPYSPCKESYSDVWKHLHMQADILGHENQQVEAQK